MQPGVIGLRGAISALWQNDLRAVREDRYDPERGKEALAFIQRFNAMVSELRLPIQQAWGSGALVHVADNPDIAGPGQRVSQTRIKLRNHGDAVVAEAFSYLDGTPTPNPSLGLDREIKVADIGVLAFVQELYRTQVAFLQVALTVDLALADSVWLYEQMVADHFAANSKWPTLGELYQRATREFAVDESFETVTGMFRSEGISDGDIVVGLGIDRLHRCRGMERDADNFVQAIRLAVEADQALRRLDREDAVRELQLDDYAATRLGRILASAHELCREPEVAEDFSTWSFLPSYNVHFFRRVKTVDDYLATAANINPTNGSVAPGVNGHSTRMSHEDTSALPDGVVTFLMTDVVESTQLWLQNRAQMYGAMRAQAAVMSEPWSDNIPMAIRVAILTGEADAQDRDYRSPAVNRCAKLRRRAVGNQILVSESTYSIVADILRGDMRLESVGKRRLEGHDRPEEVYVLQHGEVALAAGVAEDEV